MLTLGTNCNVLAARRRASNGRRNDRCIARRVPAMVGWFVYVGDGGGMGERVDADACYLVEYKREKKNDPSLGLTLFFLLVRFALLSLPVVLGQTRRLF